MVIEGGRVPRLKRLALALTKRAPRIIFDRRTALHEATHAIVGKHVGVPVHAVYLAVPILDGMCSSEGVRYVQGVTQYRNAIALSREAWLAYLVFAIAPLVPSEGDNAVINEILNREYGLTMRETVRARALLRARGMVSRHRIEIEKLARVLLRKGFVKL